MFRDIRANDLDISEVCRGLASYLLPFAPRQLDRIAGVGHNIESETQIVACDSIAEAVALTLYLSRAKITQALLDRVDPKIQSLVMLCDKLGQRRLTCAGKSREDVQSWHGWNGVVSLLFSGGFEIELAFTFLVKQAIASGAATAHVNPIRRHHHD